MNEGEERTDNVKDVPYIVFEGAMAREERHAKRLVIALVCAIIAILATNIAWLWIWNSYEFVGEESSVEYSQDGTGLNVIGDRNFSYGTESQDQNGDESAQEEERSIEGDTP